MAKSYPVYVKFDKYLGGSPKGKILTFKTAKARKDYISVMKRTFPSSKFENMGKMGGG